MLTVGIIGVGVVGSALQTWFKNHTDHIIKLRDPFKGYKDNLQECDAIFICIPVRPGPAGQDITELGSVVEEAKFWSKNVFIKSTVLPGTNDLLGTISCPEFLTERNATQDMADHDVLVGMCDTFLINRLFPSKYIHMVRNVEAEMAKIAHNCAGAMKVTYWNLIYDLCEKFKADYEAVMGGVDITGFIDRTHTQVPGPDGKFGYGGKCFPENMEAFRNRLAGLAAFEEFRFISTAMDLNKKYRSKKINTDEEKKEWFK